MQTTPDWLAQAVATVPSTRQLAWQAMEFYGFVHFGMNTFTGQEWGDGTADPALFDPAHLDAGQWAAAAKSAGMRGLILTCKHHDGFCLWPSALTGYTVAASPWKNGRGDVVREVADACRRAGLKFGVYLSPWDRHEKTYGTGAPYDEYYLGQLRELLTNYGDIFCVWLDGACGEGPNGRVQRYNWDAYYALVRELQPGAVISVCGPDVRWCGNEAGRGRPSEWSVVPAAFKDPAFTASHSQKVDDGTFSRRFSTQDEDLGSRAVLEHTAPYAWYPAEVNTSIRPGWFYHESEDGQVRDPETLFGIYMASVGANANFLLNLPPDRDGRIAAPDCASLAGLGALLRRRFGRDLAPAGTLTADSAAPDHPAAAALAPAGYWQAAEGRTGAVLTLTLPEPAVLGYLSLREQLTCGQRIEAGEVYLGGVKAAGFTVVGARRILRLPAVPVRTVEVRLTACRATPTLREIAAYAAEA